MVPPAVVGEPTAPIPLDRNACNVALPVFEGPLDLLLHLIQKHELDVFDIPISFVTARYLEYLRLMHALNLDVAAEYLLMAATLAHIKSRMLLPSEPTTEESAVDELLGVQESDPRAELVRRLLEYQKYKAAAEELASRGIAGRDVFVRGAEVVIEDVGPAALASVPLFSLVEALQRLAKKKKLSIAHEVTAERVSISERIGQLVDRLRERRAALFEELFDGVQSTQDLVVTFLALLEMTRLRMTKLYQSGPLEPIHVSLAMEVLDWKSGVIDDP